MALKLVCISSTERKNYLHFKFSRIESETIQIPDIYSNQTHIKREENNFFFSSPGN